MERTHTFKDLTVKNLRYTPGKQVAYYDAEAPLKGQPGQLGIRIGPRKKTWFVQYRFKSKRRFVTLGHYPDLSLADARIAAADQLRKVFGGLDPVQERQRYRKAPTMIDLWSEYTDSVSFKKKKGKTTKEETRIYKSDIKPELGNMKVVDISRSVLRQLLNNKAKNAPVMANNMMALLSVMFNEALDLEWVDVHPMYKMKKPGSTSKRKRILSDEEIKSMWVLSHELDVPPYNNRDVMRLNLLTAQRPGEIMSMRWNDLDLDHAVWDNSDNKTSTAHLVPLSPLVLDIIKARSQDGEYVFPGRAGHVKEVKKVRKLINEELGLPSEDHWTSHDLRRTARTLMSRLSIEHHIRERMLGHTQKGIVAVYDRHDYSSEKRKGFNELEREIKKILGI